MTEEEVLADARTLGPGESRSYVLANPNDAFLFADVLAMEGFMSSQDSPGGAIKVRRTAEKED